MKTTMIKAAWLVLLLTCHAGDVLAQTTQNSITVNGVGQIEIDQTTASIRANVTTQNLDPETALSQNNAAMANVFNALNQVGISDEAITTTQFNFNPNYQWDDGQYIFMGYQVSNGIRIELDDIELVGSVLNLLVDAGVSRIHSISFGADNLESIRQQAIVRATEDARTKAEILATATGVSLGPVINIVLTSANAAIPADESLTGSVSPRPPATISGGSMGVVEHVKIVYSIAETVD